jgi:hypothetical protein
LKLNQIKKNKKAFKNNMESISNEKIKLKEGNTYFFICYALVCGGKSTFFEQILSQTSTEENKSKYNVIMVSSDQIRSDLSKEMQIKNPGMTFKQCFDKLSRETAREFDTQIFQAIKKRDKSKINIILVDKNYPQGINQFVKKFCKYQSTQFFIVFIPNLSQGIKINELNFPFSLNYFIQCYLRLKNRHGHEVLNGEDEESRLVYISFFKLFQNFDFYHNLKGNKSEDAKNQEKNEKEEDKSTERKKERSRDKENYYHKTEKNFDKNIFIQKIDFTDESKEIEIDKDTEKFFNDVIAKMKPFDMKDIKEKYQKDIDNYFDIIDKEYDGKDAFKDTREKIKDQVTDLLKNGYNEK